MTTTNTNKIKEVEKVQDEGEVKPWEQQPTEPKKHYQYYQEYLQLSPPRSLDTLIKKLKKKDINLKKKSLYTISSQQNWTSRTHAYDDYMSRLFFESEAAAIVEMKTRHLKDSRKTQKLLDAFIEKVNGYSEKVGLEDISKLAYCLDVAVRCKDKMMRYERLSLGESTEHIKRTDNSFEALKAAIDLSAKRLEGQVQKSNSKKDSKKPDDVIDAEFSKK